jgi:sulfur transfer protein SufE
VCTLGNDGRVYFEVELDFALTKGLAVLQVEGFSGTNPVEIHKASPDLSRSWVDEWVLVSG